MRKGLIFILAIGLCSGLLAYGVSPSQYQAGQSQDAQSSQGIPPAPQPLQEYPQGYPGQPMPQPVPGGALAPGQAQQMPPPQGYPQQFPGNAQQPGSMPLNLKPGAPSQPQNYDALAIPDWAKGWKHYHWEEAKKLWDDKKALFCDARSKAEYDQGHIPGAIPLPANEFDKFYQLYQGKITHAQYLVTYCHGVGCQLSNKVAQHLVNEKKLKNVGSFFGGWPQWQQHNMPVETGGEPKPR